MSSAPGAAEARPWEPAAPSTPRAGAGAGVTRTAPARETAAQERPTPLVPLVLEPVPFLPGHVSTEAERNAFRALADSLWERYGAAVSRTLTRMPALRGHEQEAARADLIALQLYLRTEEGPLGHAELGDSLRSGEERLLPYAACVASGLRRMPSFRGLAVRGGGAPDAPPEASPPPGRVLRGPGPLSTLTFDGSGRAPAGTRYAIWSVTGRRVRHLLEAAGASGSDAPREEVVFAPGTAFRVLDVRPDGPSRLTLLRELPVLPPANPAGPEPLDDQDRAVLARIDEALARRTTEAGRFAWPDRCAGPVAPHGNRMDD